MLACTEPTSLESKQRLSRQMPGANAPGFVVLVGTRPVAGSAQQPLNTDPSRTN